MQGEGDHPPVEWSGSEVERAKGCTKRSAEAWGYPLRARGAELPLASFDFAVAVQDMRAGVIDAKSRRLRCLRFAS